MWLRIACVVQSTKRPTLPSNPMCEHGAPIRTIDRVYVVINENVPIPMIVGALSQSG